MSFPVVFSIAVIIVGIIGGFYFQGKLTEKHQI